MCLYRYITLSVRCVRLRTGLVCGSYHSLPCSFSRVSQCAVPEPGELCCWHWRNTRKRRIALSQYGLSLTSVQYEASRHPWLQELRSAPATRTVSLFTLISQTVTNKHLAVEKLSDKRCTELLYRWRRHDKIKKADASVCSCLFVDAAETVSLM